MMVGKYKSSKKAINSLILVLLWILFSNAYLRAMKLLVNAIFEDAVPCIVQIHTYDKTGAWLCMGSGFFIGPGKILTSAHVIEDAYSVKLISSMTTYNRVTILKMDEHMDLALLMINASGEKSLQLENEQIPIRDQYLVALGYNYDEDKNAVSYGLVHAVISDEGVQDIVNSVSVFSGWSGGPLLNLDGYVIGVHKLGWGDGPIVAFSTGLKTIKEFLERPNNPKDLAWAGSNEYWSVVLEKLGEYWSAVVSSTKEVIEFLFFYGVLRGIYIISLAGILIGWRTPFLWRYLRAWKRRKAVNKIIKWSNGASSLEMEPVLETKGTKGKYSVLVDNGGDKIVVDRIKIEERIKLILRKCRASSGRTEDLKEL
ncbi:MAG: trypsin-like peptidase domain-containing protein [Candidatus Aminicenantes bacterium]|nr:trypsin-like peptidase domain-containing protein [Candidatus Aminicenantes bacterium]